MMDGFDSLGEEALGELPAKKKNAGFGTQGTSAAASLSVVIHNASTVLLHGVSVSGKVHPFHPASVTMN